MYKIIIIFLFLVGNAAFATPAFEFLKQHEGQTLHGTVEVIYTNKRNDFGKNIKLGDACTVQVGAMAESSLGQKVEVTLHAPNFWVNTKVYDDYPVIQGIALETNYGCKPSSSQDDNCPVGSIYSELKFTQDNLELSFSFTQKKYIAGFIDTGWRTKTQFKCGNFNL